MYIVRVLVAAFLALQSADIPALYQQRKFPEAARALEERLARHPEDFSSQLLLGLCYQQSDDLPRAEQVFLDAVKQRSGHADALFFLARVQYLRGKFAEAEKNARLSMQSGGSAGRAYNLIGLVLAEQQANNEALQAYETAASRGFAEAYLNAGILLLKLGRAREALRRLDSAAEGNPKSSEVFYHQGRAHLELNQRMEAEKDLAAAVSFGNHAGARRLLDQLRSGGVATNKRPYNAAPAVPPIRFRNAAAAGLSFVLENHPTSEKYLIETIPGGVAAFDYNNDGRPDIFFTNGAAVPSLEKESPKYFNRLYRNDGGMKFTDVTTEAGVAGAGYSMGVAAGDYDNDGFVDLFVAGVNRNLLLRNTGTGKFEDVTARAGIHSGVWSVAAGWFDYDNDGYLDLFVVNYVKWSPALDRYCGDPALQLRVYCHPSHFEGLANTLYRNRGDGTFEDVSKRAGIAAHIGKGMSVAFANYDQDGFPDVFVANDTLPNFLFHNRGDGTFEERALEAGVALTDDGKAVSSMGADFRDYDNDGLPDISVTALSGETFPLFRNQGKGFFRDVTYPSRAGLLSAKYSGWSNGLVDLNNDGWKDLFSANSHVTDNIERLGSQKYRQTNSIFVNLGDGTFQDVSAEAGQDFRTPRAHRGAAFADFNGDGRMDAVVTALGEPAELWENLSPGNNHWILVKLQGTRSNRDGIGAQIRIGNQHNQMTTSVGYASSSHHGVHFGLGKAERIERIEVRWPSGTVQSLENVQADRVVVIREPK